jgi:hypothetical protein
LTGREPFEGETILKRLMAHQERPAPKLRDARPDAPAALELAFQKLMAKKPAERPATMTELIALLESCKAAAVEARATAGEAPKSRPELKVFNEPLKRALPVKTPADPPVFDPRETVQGPSTEELRLEDLAMDVRSESPPVLPATAPELPRPRSERPRRQPGPQNSRDRRTSTVAGVFGSLVLVGVIGGGLFLVSRSGSPRPKSRPEVAIAKALTPEAEPEQSTFTNPDTRSTSLPAKAAPQNVILKEPGIVSPGNAMTAANSAKPISPLAPSAPAIAPAATAPAIRKPAVSAAPRPRPEWVILGDRNRYFARRIPEDAFKKMGELAKNGHALKCIAFSPNGGWVILWDKNGHSWDKIPPESAKLLNDLATKGEELKSISFTPSGGFTVLFGWNGNLSHGIPDDTLKELADLTKRNVGLKSVSYAPNGGSVIIYGKNGYSARKAPDEAVKKLTALAKRGAVLKSIAFAPDGGWAILHGKTDFFARDVPDEAFKVLGDMASKGALLSLTFPVRPLIRLSKDDPEARR